MPDLTFEPTLAHENYELVLDRAMKLAPSAVQRPTIDTQRAAIVALAVWKLTQEPEVAVRFALLPAALFDPTHIENLHALAWAIWHAEMTLRAARVGATDAKLSVILVDGATLTRAELIRILDYHLDDPKDRAELAAIISGAGYLDLANDLQRLRALAIAHAAELAGDKRYRPELVEQCLTYSEQIISDLGLQDRAIARQLDLQQRIWTLLLKSYTEVADTGRFIFRDTAMAERFPSLFTASRRYTRMPTAAVEPTTEPEVEGELP